MANKKIKPMLYPDGKRPSLYPMNVKGMLPKAFKKRKNPSNWNDKLNLRYKSIFPFAG